MALITSKSRILIVFFLFLIGIIVLFVSCERDSEVDDPFHSLETVTDVDGNEYRIVAIFSQIWFAENLKTTRLNDSTPILDAPDSATWVSADTAAYCYYQNLPELYRQNYGALYNWHAIKTEKLCPNGWRVPTEEDWQMLVDSLKGEAVAGGKMKIKGSDYWTATNAGATNSSGFRALPGGYRNLGGEFKYIHDYGFWWSNATFDNKSAWYRALYYYSPRVYKDHFSFNMGFSVRCIKIQNP